MKLSLISSLVLLAAGSLLLLPGCMTSKTVTLSATPGGQATTNVVVNESNLALDCAAVQAEVGLAVAVAVQKDPAAKPIILNIQTVLQGVLTGANSNSVPQIAALIKSSGNAAVVSNLTPLVNSMSSLEQTLVKKYGATVGGEIGIALATAVSNGITDGL